MGRGARKEGHTGADTGLTPRASRQGLAGAQMVKRVHQRWATIAPTQPIADAPDGRDAQRLRRAQMVISGLDQMPGAHNPFRCAHADEIVGSGPWSEVQKRSVAFQRALSVQKAHECPYHWADWAWAAQEASAAVRRGVWPTEGEALASALAAGRTRSEAAALCSLFDDALSFAPEGITNGQHRGCALRFAGAREVPQRR